MKNFSRLLIVSALIFLSNNSRLLAQCPITTPASNLTVECDGAGNIAALTNWLATQGGAVAGGTCAGSPSWSNNFVAVSDSCGETGSALVIFTLTDGGGITSTTVARFTIQDSNPPTIFCAPNEPADNDLGSCTSLRQPFPPLVFAEACSGPGSIIPTTTTDFNIPFPIGTTTVVWTATDGCLNTSTCSYNIIVSDIEEPHVACPNDLILTISSVGNANMDEVSWSFVDEGTLAVVASGGGFGAHSSNVVIIHPTSAGPFTFNISTDVLGGFGDNLATWTITCNGSNISSGSVGNPGGPSQTLADNGLALCSSIVTTYNTDPGFCTYTADATWNPTIVENCGIVTTTYALTGATVASGGASIVGQPFNVGTTTITWVSMDPAGNSDTCSFDVVITDIAPPILVTPASDATFECDGSGNVADLANWLATQGGAVAIDPCGPVVWTNDYSALTPTCGGTGNAIVTFTATGPDALFVTTTATFTIADTTPPTLTCPPDEPADNDQGFCSSYRQPFPPTVTDICDGGAIVPTTTTDFNIPFPVGTTTVTWTAMDACGNIGTCSYDVVVSDAEAPHVGCPNELVLTVASVGNSNMDEVSWSLVDDNLGVVSSGGGYGAHSSNVVIIDQNTPGPFTFNISTEAGGFGDNLATWSLTCNGSVVSSGSVGNIAGPSQTLAIGGLTACNSIDTNLITDLGFCYYTNPGTAFDPTVIENCPGVTTTYTLTGATTGSGASTLAGVQFNPGITTIHWVSTDAALPTANVDSCSFQIIVTDSVPPIVTCPADVAVNNDPGLCSASVNAALLAATIFDNCSIVSLTYVAVGTTPFASPLSGINQIPTTVFAVGADTITYILIDGSGNVDSCTFFVTVTDNEPPVIACPANVSITAVTGACEQTYNWTFTPTDNCGIATVVATPSDPSVNIINAAGTWFALFPVGTTTVTYTVTDIHNNTSTCSFDVTVTDDELPVINNCPTNMTVNNDAGVCGATVTWVAPTVSDNCPGVFFSSVPPNGSLFPVGTTTVTYTATDASGNTATCSFDITVLDVEGPTITCAPNQTQSNDLNSCDALVTVVSPTVVDNCLGVVTLVNDFNGTNDASGTYPVGTTIVTWTATDNATPANTATCIQTITVNDTQAPSIVCPVVAPVGNDFGLCSAVVNYAAPVGTDNCPLSVTVQTGGLASGSVFPVGTTVNTFMVTDASGNTTTCSFNVVVNDTELPGITCPADQNLDLDAGCNAVLPNYTALATTTDNCGVASVTQLPAAGTTVNGAGVSVITLIVTDVNGNINNCTFNVTRVDVTPPTIVCAANQTQSNDLNSCDALVTVVGPTAADNCGPVTIINDYNGTNNATDTYPIGTTVITWTVSDGATPANTATCIQTITVNDTQAPSIVCPVVAPVGNDFGLCSAVVNYAAPVGTDNCPLSVTVQTGGLASGSVFPVGTTVNTFMVTDASGNTTTCSFNVVVNDTELPGITCPADQNLDLDAGCNAVLPNYTALATTTDNCGVASVTQLPAAGTTVNGAGVSVITLIVTDVNGNINNCTFNVTRVDVTPPTIVCAANQTQSNDLNSCDALVTVVGPTTADNCGPVTIINDYNGTNNATDTYPIGTTVITWTVSDGATPANTATCIQTITVNDTQAPSIVCPVVAPVGNDFGLCSAVVNYVAPVGTDNCPLSVTVQTGGLASGSVFPVGTTVNTFMVTDASGNTTTCSFNVVVNDTELPGITCPADQNLDLDAGCNAVLPNYTALATTTDNCGVASVTQLPAAGTTVNGAGVSVITLIVTDVNGNINNCTFNVTRVDVTPPTIVCAANQTQSNDLNSCDALVTVVGPTAADNCGPVTIINDYNGTNNATDTYPIGTTVITWTVSDGATPANTATCIQTITVNDTQAPSIVCPVVAPVGNDFGLCSAVVNYVAPVGTDNCPLSVTVQTGGLASGSVFPVGTTVNTFMVTDASGNTTTCSFNVVVNDTELPGITCPADQNLDLDAGCNAVLPNYTALATTTDNCGVASVTQLPAAGTTVNGAGVSVITLIVTDVNGNINNCTFNVTRVDVTPPTIVCAANQTQSNDLNSCDALVTVVGPTTADNCGPVTIINDYNGTNNATDTYPIGTTVITWTVSDGATPANTATCIQTITVNDTQAPSIVCPVVAPVGNDFGLCSAVVNYVAPVGTDNCPLSVTVQTGGLASGSVFPVGTTVNTFMVTDASGNTTTCSFNVVVNDTELPGITCPADQNLDLDAGCNAVLPNYTALATTTDNCGVASVTQLPAAGTTVNGAGVSVITLIVTDVNGNINNCTFNVTRVDVTPPTIVCAANQTQSNDLNSCDALVTVVGPTTADNCGPVTIINDYNGTNNATDTYPIGTTVITWTVSDGATPANTATCIQTITVNDTQAPSIVCPVVAPVGNDFGLCSAVVNYAAPVGTDNCPLSVTVQTGGLASGSVFPVGTTVNTFMVTDASGNTTTCSFNVVVNDTELPGITCPADQNLDLDAGCNAVLPNYTALATTTDNCGVASVTQLPAAGTTVNGAGVSVITLIVTDVNGNINNCTFNVTRVDVTPPTIVCAANQTQSNDLNSCDALVTVVGPTTADNCGPVTIINDYNGTNNATDTYPIGTTVITWTVSDGATPANTATCIQTITVNDTQAPSIVCPVVAPVGNDFGLCSAVVNYVAPVGTDNCPLSVTVQTGGLASGSVFPVGTTVNTFMVTDASGNTTTCSFNVVVNDTELPGITCPADQNLDLDAGCNAVLPNYTALATTTDNCGVASVTQLPAAGTTVNGAGVSVITLIVTDVNGNINNCTFNVTRVDVTPPTIVCAANQTQSNDLNSCDALVTVVGPTAADNCGPVTIINDYNGTNNATDTYPIGTTVITWTVSDGATPANTATCIQTITVNDTQAPSIVCPVVAPVGNDFGLCSAVVNYVAPVGTDNCPLSVTVQTGGLASGSVFPVGTTVNTFMVTDASGNTTTCSFNVVVNDTELPGITCPANQILNLDGACSAVLPNYTALATTTDNCGVASVTQLPAAGTTVLGTGVQVITLTVTDINGNINTCNFNVTLTDITAPTIACAPDQTQSNDLGFCSANVTVISPVANDNCGPITLINSFTGTNNASGVYPVGTTTVTWTATDGAGLFATCTQLITVNDTEVPTFTCSPDQTQTADAGVCNAAVTVLAPTLANDNCGVLSVLNNFNGTNDASGTYSVGTTTVIWTITDIHGNTSSCTQLITVTDDEDPIITCPADITIPANFGVCTATGVNLGNPTTSDNCSVATVTNDHPSTTYPLGATSVTWTVTDVNGNTATCIQVVTVIDNQIPTITCPSNVTVNTDAGVCTASGVVLGVPLTADNCSIASTTNDGLLVYPLGNTTVTWTVTDGSGNTATCTQIVTVLDVTAPTITCPADVTVSNDPGICGAIVAIGVPLATGDNCSVASVTNNAPAIFPVGTTTVTWTITDGSGNTATCNQLITVNDTEAPFIACPANISTVAAFGLCNVTLGTSNPVSSDNCAVTSLTWVSTGATVMAGVGNVGTQTFNVGVTTITYTVSDAAGNTNSCSYTVTIIDNQVPSIACAPDQTQSNDPGNCDANVTVVSPVAIDNCAIATVLNNYNGTNDASDNYPVGTTTVIWTATDVSGNTATCTQLITVLDTELPTFSTACPAAIVQANDPGVCGAIVNFVNPVGTDNCPGVTIAQTTGLPSGSNFPVGTTTNTFVITDAAGNTASCSFTITVNDTEAPVTACVDINVNTTPGLCGASVNYIVNYTDNCPGATVVQIDGTGYTSGNFFPVGTTLQSYSITDASGNVSFCTFNVTVTDNELPLVVCPSNISVNNDLGICGANIIMVQPVYSDNCNIASVINDFNGTSNGSGLYPVGTTIVIWAVTDIHGNVGTCSMTVTVTDTEAPVITCAPDQTQTADPGVCNANVIVVPPTVTDNCAILSVINDYNGTADASDNYVVGTTTVTWTATDIYGNTSTCTQDITVTDDELPTIVCAPNQTQTNDPGVCNAFVIVNGPVGVSDNCGILSVLNDYNGTNNASDTYPVGTTTVVWTVTDLSGNTETCAQNITVTDDEAPVPNAAVLPIMVGQCSASVTAPSATDNCAGLVIGTTTDPLIYNTQGTFFVTWTYTDASGNTSTQVQTVIVDDTIAPVAIVPVLPTITAECSVTVSTFPTALDNCSGILTATTTDPLTYNTQGTFVITWTYDDGNGQTTTQTQTVIVDDVTAPVPDVASLPTLTGQCSVVVGGSPTATDNCLGVIVGTTTDPLVYNTQGIFIITWTYDDGNGNTSTQTQTVIVDDVTAPVADVTPLPTLTGECIVIVATLPTATDNCIGTVTGTTTDPLSYNVQGTYVITWTYDDGNGNTSTQTQTVIVDDVTAPVADLGFLPTINGQCSATIVTVPTATDNCVGSVIGTTTDPLTYNTQGTYVVTWTYDDGNGNTSTQTQTVVVDDFTAPVADLAVLPVLTGQCSVTIVTAPTATDNCTGAVVGTTANPLTYTVQGTYTVTWTYNDGNGNTSIQTQIVIVDDTTAPIPSVASLPTLTGQCSVTVTPAPTANDNCTGVITGTTFDPLVYNVAGTYTVTWIYFDGNGNTTTQTQTVIVDDTFAPVPNTSSLADVVGQCNAAIVTPPTATDNCAGLIVGTTTDPLSYTVEGVYVVTWTYTDPTGNTSTQTQTVIVDDTFAPVPDVAPLADVTGACSATVSTIPTATDNCAGVIVGTTTDPLTYTAAGVHVITWTYDDGNGNTTTQTQNVIITDNTAPVPDQAFLQNVTGNCAVTVFTAPTATDGCNGVITGTTTDALSYNIPGTYTITWVYDDGNGNTFTQNQTVIVDPCLGVDPSGEEFGATLYPNPSNGVFTIELSKAPGSNTEMRVVDQLGQVIYVTVLTAQTQTFDLSTLKSATYYVQVLSSEGNFTKTIIITQKY